MMKLFLTVAVLAVLGSTAHAGSSTKIPSVFHFVEAHGRVEVTVDTPRCTPEELK
jgi:hypothetical protein